MDWIVAEASRLLGGWASIVLGALLIFGLRVLDVSIDSLRIITMVKGHRVVAGVLGVVEAGIFIYAISQVLQPPVHWLAMVGYACGFGVGTFTGTAIAERFVSHYVMVRILSRGYSEQIAQGLRERKYRVTVVEGEGMMGRVLILFTVMERKVAKQAIALIRQADPDAFVTFEPVERAVGGFVPHIPRTPAWWRPAVRH